MSTEKEYKCWDYRSRPHTIQTKLLNALCGVCQRKKTSLKIYAHTKPEKRNGLGTYDFNLYIWKTEVRTASPYRWKKNPPWRPFCCPFGAALECTVVGRHSADSPLNFRNYFRHWDTLAKRHPYNPGRTNIAFHIKLRITETHSEQTSLVSEYL